MKLFNLNQLNNCKMKLKKYIYAHTKLVDFTSFIYTQSKLYLFNSKKRKKPPLK